MYAVFYRSRRLTRPGPLTLAQIDLLRLKDVLLNLEIRECRGGVPTPPGERTRIERTYVERTNVVPFPAGPEFA
ncbi:hypothetical protein [Paenibacillus flagellatus]|uniref:Uncharacterized protein n=1 Tax=Paenibacillus flagellatus TaxID=2211139 RepID=A0A2V5JWH2_9BACL|nr:hypothetical protein [Paenibacillus flagellatus]PYI51058.1 hypothetical protein DLM86_27220 [Paenibacillus flagellatus]